MLNLHTEKKTVSAYQAKKGLVYKFSDSNDYIMIAELVPNLEIEGDKYGCSIPFINLVTGRLDLMDRETDLEYIGVFVKD